MDTTTTLIAEVRKIAKANPDFVYRSQDIDSSFVSCSYFGRGLGDSSGLPCIIGQAFQSLGTNTSKLQKLERERRSDDSGVYEILQQNLVPIQIESDKDLYWLSLVQRQQDSGASFKQAVDYADTRVDLKDGEYN